MANKAVGCGVPPDVEACDLSVVAVITIGMRLSKRNRLKGYRLSAVGNPISLQICRTQG